MDAQGNFCDTPGMEADLLTIDDPRETDRLAILDLLVDFNNRSAGPTSALALAILLKNPDGQTIGGLWGASGYDWLFIELLFVPDALRGRDFGRAMMERAEAIAVERGCTGVWLNTFSFQSRGFYEKLGYRIFGEITDHPAGGALYFLQKRLREVENGTSTSP